LPWDIKTENLISGDSDTLRNVQISIFQKNPIYARNIKTADYLPKQPILCIYINYKNIGDIPWKLRQGISPGMTKSILLVATL